MANDKLQSDLPETSASFRPGDAKSSDAAMTAPVTTPCELQGAAGGIDPPDAGPDASDFGQMLEELRRLTAHLFMEQEEERQRVARELHDDISQRLSLLEISLQQMKDSDYDPEDQQKLRAAREHVHSLNADVRQISRRLHPAILQDLGLSAALRAMVKEFGDVEGMPATFLSQGVPDDLSTRAATAVYRIAQEALTNVSKHAGKTHVKLSLEGTGRALRLKVVDFGLGFDQEAEMTSQGLGMICMRERARLAGGVLVVRSELGEGTAVSLEVPIEHHE